MESGFDLYLFPKPVNFDAMWIKFSINYSKRQLNMASKGKKFHPEKHRLDMIVTGNMYVSVKWLISFLSFERTSIT